MESSVKIDLKFCGNVDKDEIMQLCSPLLAIDSLLTYSVVVHKKNDWPPKIKKNSKEPLDF